jgi:uncharacterized protein YrzB (UPF0473 family)
MNNEFAADLITLIDDEGTEHSFKILDVIENDDGCFYALLPSNDNDDDNLSDSSSYYIFEVIDENGEQVLAEVEDDSLLKKLADSFEARFEDMYGHNENTENF